MLNFLWDPNLIPPIKLPASPRWSDGFEMNPIFSVLILLSAVIIGISEVVQHGSELLWSLGIVQEKALHLANDNAKGELSRKLTDLAWRRVLDPQLHRESEIETAALRTRLQLEQATRYRCRLVGGIHGESE